MEQNQNYNTYSIIFYVESTNGKCVGAKTKKLWAFDSGPIQFIFSEMGLQTNTWVS